MDIFLDGPLVFGALGALLITMAAIAYGMTGTPTSQVAVLVAILLTIGLIVFERVWETPREQVTSATNALLDAIEEDDLPGVLKLIDPAAVQMRSDAEVLMPQFEIENAGMGELRIEFSGEQNPSEATVSTQKALIKAKHLKSGMIGAYFDTLELQIKRTGDQWLFIDYQPSTDWRKNANRLDK